jgi:hypothetical protein
VSAARDAQTVSQGPTLDLVLPTVAPQGTDVPIVVRVRNASDRPLDVIFMGRTIAFDIVVAGPDGTVVWRRLQGAMIEQILQVRTMTPGESLELRDTWKAAVPPGRYTVRGAIPTDQPQPFRTPEGVIDIVQVR